MHWQNIMEFIRIVKAKNIVDSHLNGSIKEYNYTCQYQGMSINNSNVSSTKTCGNNKINYKNRNQNNMAPKCNT